MSKEANFRAKIPKIPKILKAVLKKNATVVVKVFPKKLPVLYSHNFLPQLFDIFTQIYLPYLRHFATLWSFFSNYKFEACLCDNQVNKQEQMFIHAVNDVFVLSLLTSQPLTKGVASVAKRLQP